MGLPPFTGVAQLTNGDPRLIAAQNSTLWLNGWVPQLAVNIVSQPTNSTSFAGQTATLMVVATGIPDPTYQWLRDGTNVPGQTSAALTIPNAQGPDGGNYSVVVSNVSGCVTSWPAALTVLPGSPAPGSLDPSFDVSGGGPWVDRPGAVSGSIVWTFSGTRAQ